MRKPESAAGESGRAARDGTMIRHRSPAALMTILLLLGQGGVVWAGPPGCPTSGEAGGNCSCCCSTPERPISGIALTATGCCRTEVGPVDGPETEYLPGGSEWTPRSQADPPFSFLPGPAASSKSGSPPPPAVVSRAHAPPCYTLFCTRLI